MASAASPASTNPRDPRQGEEVQGEEIASDNTKLSGSHEGIEDGSKKIVSREEVLGGSDRKIGSIQEKLDWISVSTSGNVPQARYYHSAAVIGRKMVVVGGDSDNGMLDDFQQLHLGKLCWSELGAPSSRTAKEKGAQQLPACRGHCLVTWGSKILLVTGETNPRTETVTVWSFDMETENWSLIKARGEIPVARTHHTVTRAGSVLILFGGEDMEGRKLNELHMFDMKSSMWLPLLAVGSVPSPRSKHVAALYDERLLLVFGGASKSKFLNDLYALDFESMEWSRLKTRGASPSPRADCAGVLFGDKWYIAGGFSGDTRCLDTSILDVARMTWSPVSHSKIGSPSASEGFSLVIAQRKKRAFLIAYGGKGSSSADEVEVLHISAKAHSKSPSRRTAKPVVPESKDSLSMIDAPDKGASQNSERRNTSLQEQKESKTDGQKELYFVDGSCSNPEEGSDTRKDGAISPDKERPVNSGKKSGEKKLTSYERWKASHGANHEVESDRGYAGTSEERLSAVKFGSDRNLASALHKSLILDGELKHVISGRDEIERELASAIKCRKKAERRLLVALSENETLREKLEAAELAREEAINLTNIVHAENLRLDHDLTFLKAVLEDTQRELQTTRGVLSEERTRSFQLQVELFELKQAIQSYENGRKS